MCTFSAMVVHQPLQFRISRGHIMYTAMYGHVDILLCMYIQNPVPTPLNLHYSWSHAWGSTYMYMYMYFWNTRIMGSQYFELNIDWRKQKGGPNLLYQISKKVYTPWTWSLTIIWMMKGNPKQSEGSTEPWGVLNNLEIDYYYWDIPNN